MYSQCIGMLEVDKVDGAFSDGFLVKRGLHQGSVLFLLFLIIVLEALLMGGRLESPEKLVYSNYTLLGSESLKDLKERLETKKESLE